MSLSTCEKCGGHIPLGPDASNRCEVCGAFVFPTGIHPAKRTMEGGFSLDKFLSGISKEDAETLGDMSKTTTPERTTEMGSGYWILIWDGWSSGLVMLNPRLHSQGVDCYGNPRNWFPLPEGEEMPCGHDLRSKHGITADHFQPISSDN